MINNSFKTAGGGGGKHHKFYFSFKKLPQEHKTLEEPLMFMNTHLRWELMKCRHFMEIVYFNIFRLQARVYKSRTVKDGYTIIQSSQTVV